MNTPWELIEGYLDESLSEAEAGELRAWLASDPEHVQVLIRAAHLETAIPLCLAGAALPAVALASESPVEPTAGTHRLLRGAPPVPTLVQPAAWFGSRWPVALAAGVAILATTWWFVFSRPSPPTWPVLESYQGPAPEIRRANQLLRGNDDDELQEGDVLQTRLGRATLAYRGEDTRIDLGENTTIRVHPTPTGKQFELIAGSARFGVAKQPRGAPVSVATAHASVRVLGTKFQVLASAKTTRVRVNEGRVELRQRGADPATKLTAGSMAIARDDLPVLLTPMARLANSTVDLAGATAKTPASLPALEPPACPTGILADAPEGPGAALREFWIDLRGAEVARLTSAPNYPDAPSGRDYPTSLETVEGGTQHDAYGTRWRGYLHPPLTGGYTFWIASDDQSELYLSRDDQPDGKVRIAQVTSWSHQREWTKLVEQESNLIQLEAGRTYYFEILHKEGGGGDHLSVAWQPPGCDTTVVSGPYLSPYNP